MTETVFVERDIEATADNVWATVSKGDGVHEWFSGVITSCNLEGDRRECTMADGAALKERILEVDHDAQRFRYAIDEHPLPAHNVVATIEVSGKPDGKTHVRWGAEFDAEEEHLPVLKETLSGLYMQGIASLDAHCKA